MSERLVRVFFYASLMDPAAVRRYGATAGPTEVAKLGGWEPAFTPWLTMRPGPGEVWGLLSEMKPSELAAIYQNPEIKAHGYYPEAVSVETRTQTAAAVLTYVSQEPAGVKPDPAYLKNLLELGRRFALPEDYLKTLRALG